MAAGLGFKTFTTGEVLTAADTNGYLMQGILVFATAAARDAAITSPQEGQYAFLKDSDTLVYYSGSAWATASVATNLLLNSNFAINQRSYVSAANLASGSYGFDRWKSNYTNTTLTFTASPQGQSLTINASGGLQQIIEQGLVPAGTYTLSWTGTATGRVYNSGGTPPSYAASPVTFTADGTANVVVEYTAVSTTKTLSKVQFNAGTNTTWNLATPTLQSELAACQRYYVRIGDTTSNATLSIGTSNSAGTVSVQSLALPVAMRVAPTVLDYANIRLSDGSTGYTISSASLIGGTTLRGNISCATTGMTAFRVTLLDASASGNYVGFSAEL
jgi:hypothetical protein